MDESPLGTAESQIMNKSSANSTRFLKVEGLEKKYSGRKVVDGVSFELHTGEIVALLGPNGAGKTTSFYMTVGFIKPDRGKILLSGKDISKWPMHKRAKAGLGYLAQEASAFRKMTVIDNLLSILEFQGISKQEQLDKANSLLEEFGLQKLSDNRADKLSGGERRRLEIARSLTINPDFILLDEPFTGVDPKSIHEIQVLISELRERRGLGVLLTDHSVRETIAIADRVYLMFEGKVVFSGTPTEFADDENVRRYYLGGDFQL